MTDWREPIQHIRKKIDVTKGTGLEGVRFEELEDTLDELEVLYHHKEYEGRLDKYLSFHSTIYDKSRNYTQVVITAGYATFFGLWSITNSYMDRWIGSWAALLIALSAACFVLFEVFMMLIRGGHINIKHEALLRARIEDDEERRKNEFAITNRCEVRTNLWSSRVWFPSFAFSLITGVASIGLLVYQFIKHIVSTAPQMLWIPHEIRLFFG